MHVESVNSASLLELRAIVAQRLRAYGAFEGCTAEDRRIILAQACMVIFHLTAGKQGRVLYLTHLAPLADGVSSQTVLDTMARLCPDVIAAVQAYVAAWRARFRQDGSKHVRTLFTSVGNEAECATKRIDGMDGKSLCLYEAGIEPLGRSDRWRQTGGERAAPERYW